MKEHRANGKPPALPRHSPSRANKAEDVNVYIPTPPCVVLVSLCAESQQTGSMPSRQNTRLELTNDPSVSLSPFKEPVKKQNSSLHGLADAGSA
jgi:hypothetical protein